MLNSSSLTTFMNIISLLWSAWHFHKLFTIYRETYKKKPALLNKIAIEKLQANKATDEESTGMIKNLFAVKLCKVVKQIACREETDPSSRKCD